MVICFVFFPFPPISLNYQTKGKFQNVNFHFCSYICPCIVTHRYTHSHIYYHSVTHTMNLPHIHIESHINYHKFTHIHTSTHILPHESKEIKSSKKHISIESKCNLNTMQIKWIYKKNDLEYGCNTKSKRRWIKKFYQKKF